ncbi:hypothetical protein [Gemmobacter sp. 24YEA27]|uniref:hypothetical protein n=1 Tax=Gemmobacter sp. 24YEA27 TaxID=3040672 RepID=UPI0024B3AAFA|nr:hypothetical protein [Gemmobacter sp. 24YEA27]
MTEAFFAAIRTLFGGSLKQPQVDGLNAILAATTTLPRSFRAYILATAYHETAHTMQPIREYGRGKGKKYGVVDQTGKAPYGRGYVQLTWRENYQRADRELGLGGRLAKDYDLALDPAISAQILVEGMLDGWFTGKALRDYLPGDYVGARRIVNGTDRAQQIAGYAKAFEAALVAGGDPVPAAQPPASGGGLMSALLNLITRIFGGKK